MNVENCSDTNQNINFNLISNSICNNQCIMLSIVVISKGIINTLANLTNLTNSESKENISILNITHTDSHTQNISDRINLLYSCMGAKLIFPLVIWKNNIPDTLLSTGNANRIISRFVNGDINQYKLNIMIDSIKQNIPRQNYIMAKEPIDIFNQICQDINLKCIYRTNFIDDFNPSQIAKYIGSHYKIKIINIDDIKYSLTYKQIQYYRQYGINNPNGQINKLNKSNKRKRDDFKFTNHQYNEQVQEQEQTPTETFQQTFPVLTNNTNSDLSNSNLDNLDNFDDLDNLDNLTFFDDQFY
jgi:hypothetical protein